MPAVRNSAAKVLTVLTCCISFHEVKNNQRNLIITLVISVYSPEVILSRLKNWLFQMQKFHFFLKKIPGGMPIFALAFCLIFIS